MIKSKLMRVDFHCHILPGIDDGSSCVKESTELLAMQRNQGIETVAATPHFNAERRSPSEFLEKRQAAYERLKQAGPLPLEDIRLGAEVRYYSGISRMSGLETLRLQGSKLLLLEMPFTPWTDYMERELYELSCSGDIILMLAHIERFFGYMRRNTLENLLNQGILMQTNTGFFTDRKTGRKALRMLRDGMIHAVGTDCHNTVTRPPDYDLFEKAVTKKFGNGFFESFVNSSASLLEDNI